MEKFFPLPVLKEKMSFRIHQMRDGRDGSTLVMTGITGIHTFNYRNKDQEHIKTPRPTYVLDVDETGRVAASAPRGQVYLYENGQLNTLTIWKRNGYHASRPVFSPDGSQLALGRSGPDKNRDLPFIVSAKTGKTIESKDNVTHVAWNKAAGLAYATGAGEEKRIRMENREIPASNLANCLAFSPDGTLIEWCSLEEVVLYDLHQGRVRLRWSTKNEKTKDYADRVAVTRDNKMAAIGTFCGSVVLLRIEDGRELLRVPPPEQTSYVSGLTFLEDDAWLAVARMDGSLEIYEIAAE